MVTAKQETKFDKANQEIGTRSGGVKQTLKVLGWGLLTFSAVTAAIGSINNDGPSGLLLVSSLAAFAGVFRSASVFADHADKSALKDFLCVCGLILGSTGVIAAGAILAYMPGKDVKEKASISVEAEKRVIRDIFLGQNKSCDSKEYLYKKSSDWFQKSRGFVTICGEFMGETNGIKEIALSDINSPNSFDKQKFVERNGQVFKEVKRPVGVDGGYNVRYHLMGINLDRKTL